MVERILHTLVEQLAELKLIELRDGASTDELSAELLQRLARGTEHGTGFIGWFIEAIMSAPQVEEVFATDDEIRHIFHGIR